MKAYLIPGSGEDLESRDYQAVLHVYNQLGYDPHFVFIQWKYKTIDDWVKELETKISRKDLQNSLLSGFSFGAMVALTVAAKTNPKQLLLFSLSPYFKEDMPLPGKYQEWAGKRRIHNFRKLSFNQLAKQVHCPTTVFLGSKEKGKYADMKKRAEEAQKRIASARLVVVEGVGHDVGDPRYVEAIKEALN